MGAAGRDFHNYNTIYRNNDKYNVVAFTATQIPNIEGRCYPSELAGALYPNGIPIYSENELVNLIKKYDIDEVVFSYSDVSFNYVMEKSAIVNAAGADFILLGYKETMLKSVKPVISIVAVRTGCGKSQTSRKICKTLREFGLKVVAIRHPMPYGDLVKQKVQRFASIGDLKKHNCTIEEMEEYEPHIVNGTIIYAGVDYKAILSEAEKETDVIVWDGGNNDMSFYKADLTFCVADPHRPGHELTYYPGANNVRLADIVIINKVDTADPKNVEKVRKNIYYANPNALIIEADSPVKVDNPELIKGKKVLIIEDGPTLTHGGMKYGAGMVAAEKYNPLEIIDPRPYTVRSINETFKKYPDTGKLLPAMGYGEAQLKDLEETINNINCDTVVIGTPIDLRRVIKIKQATVRVTYDLEERTKPDVRMVLEDFIKKMKIR
jgi:predicted GTPase